jgi:hypothetical protein
MATRQRRPPGLEDIIKEYGTIRSEDEKRSRHQEFLDRLNASVGTTNPVLKMPKGCLPGLLTAGGKLLGDFVRMRPSTVSIELHWSSLTPAGFVHLIDGLLASKGNSQLKSLQFNMLRIDDAGLSKICELLSGHPSLKNLALSGMALTDDNTDTLFRAVRDSKIEKLMFSNNKLEGFSFVDHRDAVATNFKNLFWIDLSGNPLDDNEAIPRLIEMLTANRKLYVRSDVDRSNPRRQELLNLSLSNLNDNYIPSRVMAASADVANLLMVYEQFAGAIRGLPPTPTVNNTVADESLRILTEQVRALADQMEAERRSHSAELIRLNGISERYDDLLRNFNGFTEQHRIVVNHLEDLGSRLQETTSRGHEVEETVFTLTMDLRRCEDTVRVLDNEIKRVASEMAMEVVAQMESMMDGYSSNTPAARFSELSPIQQAYVIHFRKTIVEMFCAARVINSGLVQGKAQSGGTVQTILRIAEHLTPVGGGGFYLLSCIVSKVNNAIVRQRMRRLASLGTTEVDVVKLADEISIKLVTKVEIVPNPVDHSVVRTLLEYAEDVIEMAVAGGGAIESSAVESKLFDHISDAVSSSVVTDDRAALPTDEAAMIQRAAKDANALLAKAVKINTSTVNKNQLFLFAFPTITVIRDVYSGLLKKFWEDNAGQLDFSRVTINEAKKKKFFALLGSCFHQHANLAADAFGLTVSLPFVVEKLVSCVESFEFDGVRGVFYLKNSSSPHVSFRNHIFDVRESFSEHIRKGFENMDA